MDFPVPPPGAKGDAGAAGENAFTTTLGFDWPNPAETVFVPIPEGTGDWMGPVQPLWISDGVHSGLLFFVSLGAPADGVQIATLLDGGSAGNPAAGTTIAPGASVSPGGKPGAAGAAGATGATGPSQVHVIIPATLTTSSGEIIERGAPLAAALSIPANSIKMRFGSGYSSGASPGWKWELGYIVDGSGFTAIATRNTSTGAVVKWSIETLTHSAATMPALSSPAARCTPTNFPSPSDGKYIGHSGFFGAVS